MKEELQLAENKKREASTAYNAICEKVMRTNSELSNVSTTASKLRTLQRQCKESIDNLKDKIESSEAMSADVFVSSHNYSSVRHRFFIFDSDIANFIYYL